MMAQRLQLCAKGMMLMTAFYGILNEIKISSGSDGIDSKARRQAHRIRSSLMLGSYDPSCLANWETEQRLMMAVRAPTEVAR
jgi:hypothetical protein